MAKGVRSEKRGIKTPQLQTAVHSDALSLPMRACRDVILRKLLPQLVV
jgi:hypothetical protein